MTDWYAEGEIAGRKKGRAEGIEEERIRKSAEDIVAIMREFGCSLEKALEVVNVTEEIKPQVLELIRGLPSIE
ncbi:MAG: hypothetical protein J5707_00755 [Candidatus Methanomethylophilus sp.]|nr:hypothetical protein [Methanomethylophilus sp.]